MKPGDTLVVEARTLDAILDTLRRRGHTLVGPTIRDGAIVLDEIDGAADLPRGMGDEQDAGRYRLRARDDFALFGYAVGPHAWKRYLHPAAVVRWRARREKRGFVAEADQAPPPSYAFVGVRPCELAAIRVQDRVFLGEPFVDPAYRSRREPAFVLAVDCGAPAGTCFCASLGTGTEDGPGLRPRAHRAHARRPARAASSRSAASPVPRSWRARPPERPSRATWRRRLRSRRRPRSAWAARSTPRASRSCCTGATRTRTGTRWRSAASAAATARWSVPPASARRSRT